MSLSRGRSVANDGWFGDGSDGVVTLVADTTLTRDMFYDTLTTGAFKLLSSGFRVFVKNRCTVSAGGGIERLGGDGSGATGGSAGVAGSLSVGSSGAAGGITVGGDSFTIVLNSLGGSGGTGGSGSAGGGGLVFAPTQLAASAGGPRQLVTTVTGRQNAAVSIRGGTGGSGGGGDGVNSGGGAGAGGPTVHIAARILQMDGTIRANGGNGAAGVAGDSGGGGGGGGGTLFVTYEQKLGAGTMTASGGTGGAGVGTGTAGANGAAGTVIELQT